MWAIEAAAAATPEMPRLAPAPADGLDAASSTTGSRMFPSTSPTSPPARATAKHHASTATRTSGSEVMRRSAALAQHPYDCRA
ncbi:MAG: hypothetical protein M3R09_04680, partial [Actinomycetota bacterium]|nr:hypothetical protein [Actinomycetota bacterium]